MAIANRLAICNEIFKGVPFAQVCRQVREIGYEGLEIAPFTLAEDASTLPLDKRNEYRDIMRDEGLEFVGLHWLLTSPPGLHVTTRDEQVRERSWEFVHRMVDLCADLAGCNGENNGVVVFGSPKQRSTTPGVTPREAKDVLAHGLAHAAPLAESRSVKILLEALSPDQSDVVNCLGDAVTIVKSIGSPAVQTMFDTHNAVAEKDPHPELIRRHAAYIHHVHVNEMDGREPGTGSYDFAALLAALAEARYSGWISLEAFDFTRDPVEIARRSIEHIKNSRPQEELSSL
ncbi:MAG: sugar phosphate isomerase/epimerase [Acidobacteriaceae bacterium]|nr:sugar phosphate isomerase/epimerase [Acidobacteriaceae bacterium]